MPIFSVTKAPRSKRPLQVEVDEHREVARGKAVAVPARLQRATAAEDLDERQGDLLVGGRDAHEDNGAGEVAGKEGLLVVSGRPTASTTTSAPKPPVYSRIFSTASSVLS